jgi:hypothetical protein
MAIAIHRILAQKICAIVKSRDFDTVVVASKNNQKQAQACLEKICNTSTVVGLLE